MKRELVFWLSLAVSVFYPVAQASSFSETQDVTISPDFCSLLLTAHLNQLNILLQ